MNDEAFPFYLRQGPWKDVVMVDTVLGTRAVFTRSCYDDDSLPTAREVLNYLKRRWAVMPPAVRP